MDMLHNALGGKAKVGQHVLGLARAAKEVVDPVADHRDRAALGQQGTDRLPQPADDAVLLAGDDTACLPGGGDQQLLVQRLDGVDIDDPGVDTLLGQDLGRVPGHAHHHAGGYDGHVLARAQEGALAQFKLIAGQGLGVDLGGQAGQPEIGGTGTVQQGLHRQAHLIGVGGADHRHVGQHPHQSQVLAALVGGPVLAHAEAAVGAHYLHIQLGKDDGGADLLVAPAGGKHGKGAGKDLLAAGGKARGHAHHVLLGDAQVKKPVGKGLGEHTRLGGAG